MQDTGKRKKIKCYCKPFNAFSYNSKREDKEMKMKSAIRFVTVILLFIVVVPFSLYGADGQIKISQPVSQGSFPIVINQGGSYVLTSNLKVDDPDTHAIRIEVNDVTIDLNGHSIQGPFTGPPFSGGGMGINAQNRYSITIKNGRVWGFASYGVYLYSSPGDPSEKGAGHIVDGIHAANNGIDGIVINAGLVANCTINNNNDDGITAYDTTIVNSTAHNNVWHGFNLEGCILTGCTANYNQHTGIFAEARNRIEGSNLRYNGTYGLYLNGTRNYAVQNVGSLNTSGNFYDAHSGTPGANYMPTAGDNANYGF